MTPTEEMLERYAEWFIALLRDLNSAMFVMQEVPNWREKYEAAKVNPLLNDQLDRVEALSRALVEHALANRGETAEFREQIDRLRQALRKPPQ